MGLSSVKLVWVYGIEMLMVALIYIELLKNAINGLERPKYLCREKKEENVKVEKLKK